MANAKEAGRFYTKEGDSAYTKEMDNGKTRKTHIGDCRKDGLLPSVTTVMNMFEKYGLTLWKIKLAIQVALEAPDMPQETIEEQVSVIYNLFRETASESARDGTRIHAIVEEWYQTGNTSEPKLIDNVEKALEPLGKQDWKPEKTCVGKLGYAGKVDLHSKDWVIDFKSTGKFETAKLYSDHFRQVSAYAKALGCKYGAIVFICRETYECRLEVIDDRQMREGWREFKAMLQCYKTVNKL